MHLYIYICVGIVSGTSIYQTFWIFLHFFRPFSSLLDDDSIARFLLK